MENLLFKMYAFNYNYIRDYCHENGYKLITKIEDATNYPDTMYIQKGTKDICKVCIDFSLSKQEFILTINEIGE